MKIAANSVNKRIFISKQSFAQHPIEDLNAIADPTNTGAIDADSVLGLIPINTDFMKLIIKVIEEIS